MLKEENVLGGGGEKRLGESETCSRSTTRHAFNMDNLQDSKPGCQKCCV